LNGHTEKAWPSYQTIADATGKSVKTIQRAIRELETSGWFEIWRGNGIGHNTEYRPFAASMLRASNAREKTDKVVTLYPGAGGRNRPARRSDVSGEGGQKCLPNPEKKKYINLTRARTRRRALRRGEPFRSLSLPRPRRSRSNSGAVGPAIMAFRRLKLSAFGR
jgi:hypothetical protein